MQGLACSPYLKSVCKLIIIIRSVWNKWLFFLTTNVVWLSTSATREKAISRKRALSHNNALQVPQYLCACAQVHDRPSWSRSESTPALRTGTNIDSIIIYGRTDIATNNVGFQERFGDRCKLRLPGPAKRWEKLLGRHFLHFNRHSGYSRDHHQRIVGWILLLGKIHY